MSEYVDFHYMPLEGKITGEQVLKQTEDAINDLGNKVYSLNIDQSEIDEAIEKSNEAINTANSALAAVTTDRAVWKNTVAEMKATDIDLGVTAATRGEMVFNDGNGAFYGVRIEKSGDVDSDDTVFLDNGNVAERIQSMNIIAKGNNIIFVTNVAELIDSDALIGNVYGTTGYYSANDGGAGLYSIRTRTQSDVEDGGSIIFLDNGNVAELITDGTVNVKQFGAYGDGTHDDTDAIQSASLYLSNKGGGELFFPVGTYNYTRLTIRNAVVFVGDNASNTVLICKDNSTEDATGLGFGSSLRRADENSYVFRAGFKNLTIATALTQVDTAQDNNQTVIGLNLAGCAYTMVENVSFGGFGYGGIVFSQCASGTEGLGFSATSKDGNYNFIQNVQFGSCGKYNPDHAVIWFKYKANSNKLYGVFVKGCTDAIGLVIIVGNDNLVVGGTVESSKGVVSCKGSTNTFIGIRCEGVSANAYELLDGCTRNKIIDSVLTGVTGSDYVMTDSPNNFVLSSTDNLHYKVSAFPPSSNYSSYYNKGFLDVTGLNGDGDEPLYLTSNSLDDGKYPCLVLASHLQAPSSGQIFGRLAFRNRKTNESGISATIDAVAAYNKTGYTNLAFSTGNGSTLAQKLILDRNGHLYPATDNTYNLGTSTNRWANVYAGTGTINTSDEREKQDIAPIEDAVFRAWAKVDFVQFRFKDAVSKKGDKARIHFGLIAQQVKEAFDSEGLDAFQYGLLCYDEWEDDDGNVIGNRYGIRYDEALALECAYQRWRTSYAGTN